MTLVSLAPEACLRTTTLLRFGITRVGVRRHTKWSKSVRQPEARKLQPAETGQRSGFTAAQVSPRGDYPTAETARRTPSCHQLTRSSGDFLEGHGVGSRAENAHDERDADHRGRHNQ